MRGRAFVVLGFAIAAASAPVACVDLFHDTDFVTLCQRDPNSTSCGGEGGVDAATTDAPSDAGTPPVDFCAWPKPEARRRATHACAWLGACGGPLGESVFGPCMTHAMWAYDCDLNPTMRPNGATRALWACLAEVKSCADVDACVFGEDPTQCNAVPSGEFTACGAAGTATHVRVECGRPETGPPVGVDPCALTGRTCERIDDSTSACTGVTKKTCTLGQRCEGTSVVDCQPNAGGGQVDRGLDCAAFGAGTCVEKGGVAACAPQDDAGACTRTTLDVRCVADGGAAFGCVGGREIAIDCSKLAPGATCDDATPIPAYDPLRACADRSDAGACSVAAPDSCSGTRLQSCAQGIAWIVDCASMGLGPCAPIAGGVVARCTPP